MDDKKLAILEALPVDAVSALINLSRYRIKKVKMVEVWEPIDDYSPDEQRQDDRRVLCNAIVDFFGDMGGEE